MTVTTLAIDLAKRVFQLHGVDAGGKVVLRKAVSRSRLVQEVAKLAPELVAFEAGSGAHHWARRFEALGLRVRMIAPHYVRPFRRGASKDDAADAEAICEAALRPSLPTVAVKKPWQQDVQAMHRIRQDLVERRTALCNQYRGHLVEFGIAAPQSIAKLRQAVLSVVTGGEPCDVPPMLRRWLSRFLDQLDAVEGDIELATAEIERSNKAHEACQRLAAIPGIGPLTASALHAAYGDGAFLKNGRQAAAWLGLTPRRYGSGGKSRDLGITKRGDTYLRCLLVHGGRALLSAASRRPDRATMQVTRLKAAKPPNVAAVALANRNARLAWRLLRTGESYDARKAGAA